MKTLNKGRIIARLRGGLGNQLFIYAAAIALAQRSERTLFLDGISGFDRDTVYRRESLLQRFKISAEMLQSRATFGGPFGRLRRKFLLAVKPSAWLTEAHLADDAQSLPLGQRTWYLEDLYQSNLYFSGAENVVRCEFTPVDALLPNYKNELAAIEHAQVSVAVCVRSFQDVPEQSQRKIVPFEYYRDAIELIKRLYKNPIFFVFTDNQKWARTWLSGLDANFIFPSPKPENVGALTELRLISECRHHVIGNGTLHWWGAWLANGSSQIVVRPGDKFIHGRLGFPSHWLKVP